MPRPLPAFSHPRELTFHRFTQINKKVNLFFLRLIYKCIYPPTHAKLFESPSLVQSSFSLSADVIYKLLLSFTFLWAGRFLRLFLLCAGWWRQKNSQTGEVLFAPIVSHNSHYTIIASSLLNDKEWWPTAFCPVTRMWDGGKVATGE